MSERRPTGKEFRVLVIALATVMVIVVFLVVLVLAINHPPSANALVATAQAMPSPTPLFAMTPTPIPTIPGVNPILLVCQRDAGFALNKRQVVGSVNISDDHLFLMGWVAHGWAVQDVDDALPGLIGGFEAALDVWQGGCAVFDRVRIMVWERQDAGQWYRFSVQASVDDLLKWRAGELTDRDLLARLEVTVAGP